MRIIGGELKGRKFIPPAKKWPTRPTTDFAKEGLYNILTNRIDFEETIFLDLFGGTGSHCYEIFSRGCRDLTYVDKYRGCVKFVVEMARTIAMEEFISIHSQDVFKFLKVNSKKFTYIFAGPPYPLTRIPELPDLIVDHLAPEGLLVLEHNPDHNFEDHSRFSEARNYGTTIFSFFM